MSARTHTLQENHIHFFFFFFYNRGIRTPCKASIPYRSDKAYVFALGCGSNELFALINLHDLSSKDSITQDTSHLIRESNDKEIRNKSMKR
jgi:hypothetical protein